MAVIDLKTRYNVIFWWEQGKSQVEIAKTTQVSRRSVQEIIRKYNETGDVVDRPKSGRKRKITESLEQRIKVTALRDRRKSSSTIAAEVSIGSTFTYHPSTIRRSLIRSGLNGRVAIKKPLLRPVNKLKRRRFADAHKDWTASVEKGSLVRRV